MVPLNHVLKVGDVVGRDRSPERSHEQLIVLLKSRLHTSVVYCTFLYRRHCATLRCADTAPAYNRLNITVLQGPSLHRVNVDDRRDQKPDWGLVVTGAYSVGIALFTPRCLLYYISAFSPKVFVRHLKNPS